MTWNEAMAAFKAQTPVIYENQAYRTGKIRCTRIAEMTLYMTEDGKMTKIIGGMDKNENCVYRDIPEKFTLPKGGKHGSTSIQP